MPTGTRNTQLGLRGHSTTKTDSKYIYQIGVFKRLIHNLKLSMLFLAGAIVTFTIFVPPSFFLLYSTSLGLPFGTGTALLAGFNLLPLVGRSAASLAMNLAHSKRSPSSWICLRCCYCLQASHHSFCLRSLAGAVNCGFFSPMPMVVGIVSEWEVYLARRE